MTNCNVAQEECEIDRDLGWLVACMAAVSLDLQLKACVLVVAAQFCLPKGFDLGLQSRSGAGVEVHWRTEHGDFPL